MICPRTKPGCDYGFIDSVYSGTRRQYRFQPDARSWSRSGELHQRTVLLGAAISGVWEAIGISTWAIKLTNLIIIVTGFVLLLAGGQLRISVTILMTGVLGLAIAIISALRNPLDLTLLSYFQLFSPIIVFGLLMSILSAASQRLLLRILYLFLALQLLAATVKLWVGVSEGRQERYQFSRLSSSYGFIHDDCLRTSHSWFSEENVPLHVVNEKLEY